MNAVAQHQCVIYDGSPAMRLPSIVTLILGKLGANYPCLYVNDPAMVSGLSSHLGAAGVDVAAEMRQGSLVLSSEQNHLLNGRFDVARMVEMLEAAVRQALSDGYRGLFATGDMTWEFGPDRDFKKLLEYELALEELFQRCPHLVGLCQYHQDTLPVRALRSALYAHPAFYINETLSRINPHYKAPDLLLEVQVKVSTVQMYERLSELIAV